jgi:hypothetical protein
MTWQGKRRTRTQPRDPRVLTRSTVIAWLALAVAVLAMAYAVRAGVNASTEAGARATHPREAGEFCGYGRTTCPDHGGGFDGY